MKTLLKYLKPHQWLLILSLVLATVNQVFSLFGPAITGKILDQLVTHPNFFDKERSLPRTLNEYLYGTDLYHGVFYFLGLLIATAMVSRIAKAFQDYVVNVITQKFGASIFTDGLKHSMALPYQEFEDQRSGETLSVLTKVREDGVKFITNFINIFFGILVSIIFVSIYAIRLHWSIMPVYVVGIFLIAFITNLLSKRIKNIQKTIVSETTALAGSTTESLRNIEIVKSLGLTQQEIRRLNNNTYKILGLELRKVKSIRSLSFIQGTMVNFLQQLITLTLLLLIFKNIVTPGEYLSLMFYGFFIFGPMQEIGNIIISYREAEASLNNFDRLMKKDVEEKPLAPKKIGAIRELEFQGVSFQHQTASYKALNAISFEVKNGETIAFVGPSGSGKSTLVKLLVGLYRPKEGSIFYNHINGNAFDFDELRNQIGFVTQDTQLFAGTIKENLLFVNPDATETDLQLALERSSSTALIRRAEKGIDTVIGEGGLKLSGGEKQRIAIARALLRKPHLLIFDEATSALDSITEEAITSTIKEISREKDQITVLIAHRLSTIMHADRIYVLERGQIIETGSHDSLLALNGLYYAMWRQQIGERKTSDSGIDQNIIS
ncbi:MULTISPECIES: ABC transporter ATP-binding protein [Chryseobacterium]|uniref:ATP-binding cassette subfamily B protein n=1 Tax=Chryseobacterium camelliae TaxID=1265445 RepID=A0ABU0THI9_9FLAO|nr:MULTISPECIES: ABC transporter ATP-binding protein [Chryseobacterium]MDT3409617.1 ATP-binding cassette subfamily B protein [Pseudacidovorax intermedius]MDQ1096523.1 ATP-binding cassette subfamily B protein [Chryseobacterium camelliae]MDQ1100463.1 ATP-binding cassette subfamily B protein [Chryseobacterium sp. SORGH_AS_1048]MDR6087804.1 ATP-binding cassette subfamily B protein [Chryseobacterium sp. SORGH_AS_0909]MDR6132179.1 ATP-binding cassette subfamily B protein [Chryseobacterium sp. SORGH_